MSSEPSCSDRERGNKPLTQEPRKNPASPCLSAQPSNHINPFLIIPVDCEHLFLEAYLACASWRLYVCSTECGPEGCFLILPCRKCTSLSLHGSSLFNLIFRMNLIYQGQNLKYVFAGHQNWKCHFSPGSR